MSYLFSTGRTRLLADGTKAYEDIVADTPVPIMQPQLRRMDVSWVLCCNCGGKLQQAWGFWWKHKVGTANIVQYVRYCEKCLVELGMVW